MTRIYVFDDLVSKEFGENLTLRVQSSSFTQPSNWPFSVTVMV